MQPAEVDRRSAVLLYFLHDLIDEFHAFFKFILHSLQSQSPDSALVIFAQIVFQYSRDCHFTAVGNQQNTAEVGVFRDACDNLAGSDQILTGLAAAELLIERDDTVKILRGRVFLFCHL